MALTKVNQALSPTQWDDDFSEEWFQSNPFSAYAGTSNNNVIRMKEDFASKRGNGITFEFITNLKKGAILDRAPLLGHEQVLGEYGDKVSWSFRKTGVAMHELDSDLAAIDLRRAARVKLKDWADEDVKFETIGRLGDVGSSCDIPFEDAAAADKNAWVTANADRVLFGAAKANYSTTFATAAGNVDATNDKLNTSAVSLLKRIALLASPRITPIKVEQKSNRRWYVLFVHPYVFRDFKNSVQTTEATVAVVERNEAIFMGGDREYDGVIIHEVDDMPIYTGIGNAGIDISPAYLVGQEALGWAIKERYKTREDSEDYDQVKGLGMFGKWGMKKLCYNPTIGGEDATIYGKHRGLVTGFFAAVGD